MLKVGTILRGIYRIDSYLSSGGFGNTYVATNIEFDERVAIKEFFMKGVTQRDDNQTTVSVSNTENSNIFLEQREKFKKEARRIRQLNNPHIVRVHDLFEENGTAYYVMDYVDGENLSDRLKRTGKPMTEGEVNQILPQILDALKSIHDAGIWHLDLKPANIMVDKAGNVKLIDFGASKQLNAQKGGATTSTAISYTNGYAPREQMEQNYDKFGPWTDIYALGATLYNLLTNRRPPLPTDIDDDMSKDKHVALPYPDSVDGLRFLVLQMLKTNRLQRPQNIDAIIAAESTRKEDTPKRLHTQHAAPHNINYNDDEETIIATNENGSRTQAYKNTNSGKTSYDSLNNPLLHDEKANKDHTYLYAFVVLIIAIASFGGISIFTSHQSNHNSAYAEATDSDEIVVMEEVSQLEYQSPLGMCRYTGPVDEYSRPDGIGEAFFNDGRYYKGGFKGGNLEGKDAYFKYANGDTFEGEFRNNSFYQGKYTIAEDKSYFVGYYENGQPAGGTWYNKNGKVIQ